MEDLMLHCLNMGDDAFKASILARWTDEDWHELIRRSEKYGISAYVYHRLRALDPAPSIPGPAEQRLREITWQAASRNIRLVHQLGKILKSLNDTAIPVILLKGAYLAETVYPYIALRSMGDVDILVKKNDLHKTITHLFQNRFSVTREGRIGYLDRTTDMPYHILPEQKHFYDIIHPEWPIKLDVHISLARDVWPFRVDTDGLWERAVHVDVNGTQTLSLSPVDSLLYQCMHTSYHHHFYFGLRPLIDIAETIRHYQDRLSWKDLEIRAREWNADRCAWLTLRSARQLLGAAVPESVLTALKPELIDEELLAWAEETIFSNSRDPQTLPDDLVRLCKTRRLRSRAALMFKSVFLSRSMMATMYPVPPDSRRVFLYYPVRAKDLCLRWGRVIWRHLFRDKTMQSVMEIENRRVTLEQWLTSVD